MSQIVDKVIVGVSTVVTLCPLFLQQSFWFCNPHIVYLAASAQQCFCIMSLTQKLCNVYLVCHYKQVYD